MLDSVNFDCQFIEEYTQFVEFLTQRSRKYTFTIGVTNVCNNQVIFICIAIDAPGGFLFEWWSVFWDIFIARTNDKHSEAAAAYIEVNF